MKRIEEKVNMEKLKMEIKFENMQNELTVKSNITNGVEIILFEFDT
jgi:hypothetical protein